VEIDADYHAVETVLEPHQLRTVHEYATTQGLAPEDWPKNRTARVIAVALAVENLVKNLRVEGLSERRAVARAATLLSLDLDTLSRHRRIVRARKRRIDTPD
jgi:hypothetical protein